MPQYDSLKSFYDERAALAYDIEHMPGVPTTPTSWLARYATLQADLEKLQAAFAQTWRPPRADAVPLLPWCSICGSNQRPLVPGRMVCEVCEGILEAGTITPGEHAEASQGEVGRG